MLGMLNNVALVLMTSIGHRMGLSGTTTILPPSTSARTAAARACISDMGVSGWAPWLPQGSSTSIRLAPAVFCRQNGALMIRQKAGFRSIVTHHLAQDSQRHWYVVRK
jgi:hypothetical protein